MKNDFEIRIANLTDLDCLCTLEKNTFDPLKYHILSRRQFRYLLTKGNADILVASYDRAIVGVADLFYRKTSSLGRLYSLAVHPNFQKQSIGHLLFYTLEKTIKQKGLKGFLCELRQDQVRLLNFYTKLGCKQISILPNYYPDGMSGIKMKKLFEKEQVKS